MEAGPCYLPLNGAIPSPVASPIPPQQFVHTYHSPTLIRTMALPEYGTSLVLTLTLTLSL